MNDFTVKKFYTYPGPSYYLDRGALVFNLWLDPEGPEVDQYREEVLKRFPVLESKEPIRVADLFTHCLIQVMKMEIDLWINRYSIGRDGEYHVIAVEYLDKKVAEQCVHFTANWFRAMTAGESFDFESGFAELQSMFDATLFGGPTIYSLIEAGLKRGIPVTYLYEENQFMWGYGKKQVRGRSTTFHTDSIKDTEFTTYKDMVKDYLLMCGLPTPSGRNCMTEEQAIEEAKEQGYPVVVKPLAGHKGQGVTTNIDSEEAVRKAFKKVVDSAKEEGVSFDGAIVEKQIFGTDHRLLSVDGKFVAALQRVPAYVDGNGSDSIERLIEVENDKVVRLDNARSPLCKIKIDDDLTEYLVLQDLSLSSVPGDGERIYLRRVANISAGGVSINVTDNIHPKNVKMVEDVAKFLDVNCLGIDVLAEDIAKPWDEGNFGIIEINAGPGVFMHLAPAIGGSIDVPGHVIRSHFPEKGSERIPIISGNKLTESLADALYQRLKEIRPGVEFGSITEKGVFFNGEYFHKNKHHDDNVKIILRNPRLDIALFNHSKDDIHDEGMLHEGSDVVILEDADGTEQILSRDLLPGGYLIEVGDGSVRLSRGGEEIEKHDLEAGADPSPAILGLLFGLIEELLAKYE